MGRSSDLEMVLVEDMVSRRHARLWWESDQLQIEDLNSTNGTFINGEKVSQGTLKVGDRLLIGTSILKLVTTDIAPSVGSKDLESVAAQRRTSQVRTMAGNIEEIPLPDLMQLLGSSKKTGILLLRKDDDVGKIYFRKGLVFHALINDNADVSTLKSIFRLLTWDHGMFELDPPDDQSFPNEEELPVQEVLMEGLRQLDELNVLKDKLPDLRAKITLSAFLAAPLKSLGADELEILQLAHNFGSLEAVLNKSPKLDLETAEVLIKLFKQKYLVAQG